MTILHNARMQCKLDIFLYFQPSEPKIKSSRMLLLELTDGTQTVFGMEYQLIPALKVSTPPGTKVVNLVDMHFSRAGLLILCFS